MIGNIIATKYFSAEDWQKWLNDFALLVKDHNFDRLEYDRWRCIKPQNQTATIVVILYKQDDCIPYINIYNGNMTTRVDVEDGSLGEFLFLNIFNMEERNMAYISNTILDDNEAVLTTSRASNMSTVNTMNTLTTASTFGGLTSADLENMIDYKLNEKHAKENNNMNNVVNFDFGPCTGNDNIRMSIYGIAVKNASGTFVSYNAANASIMDVDVFNFDGTKFLYKMPVAIKDIKVGDVVIHARKPMFVTDIMANDKSLKVVDPVNGEKKEIILTRSPFGFDFATKIVNFLGNICDTTATADNPFGNLWMFMLMNNGGNTDNLLPFMLMNQNGGNIDPMMMFAIMGNKGDNSWLPFLMMSNANKSHDCHCCGNCSETKSN